MEEDFRQKEEALRLKSREMQEIIFLKEKEILKLLQKNSQLESKLLESEQEVSLIRSKYDNLRSSYNHPKKSKSDAPIQNFELSPSDK